MVVYLNINSPGFISSENFLTLLFVLLMVCLLFTWLIARSFDRGRPLMFFLWGLIFPTLSVRIVRLAFPF